MAQKSTGKKNCTNANGDRCGLMDKDGNRLTEPVYSKIDA